MAGIVRKLDYEGRVSIPKDVRNYFNLEPESELDIAFTPDAIIIRPAYQSCALCGKPAFKEYMGKKVCEQCLSDLFTLQY